MRCFRKKLTGQSPRLSQLKNVPGISITNKRKFSRKSNKRKKKRFEKIPSQKIFYENSREDTICDEGGTAKLPTVPII